MSFGDVVWTAFRGVLSNMLDEAVEKLHSSAHEALIGDDSSTEHEHDPDAEPLPPRPPDFTGDIPLHFNARSGEYDE